MQQAAYWALSEDGGQSFGPATLFFSLPGVPLWLPTIHVENETVYLFYSGAAPLKCKVGLSSKALWMHRLLYTPLLAVYASCNFQVHVMFLCVRCSTLELTSLSLRKK